MQAVSRARSMQFTWLQGGHADSVSVLLQAEGAQLYIISLGVLAPYRSQGVGQHQTSAQALEPITPLTLVWCTWSLVFCSRVVVQTLLHNAL